MEDLEEEKKKEMITIITASLADKASMDIAVKQAFANFDKNEDGFLQKKEFYTCLAHFYREIKLEPLSKGQVLEFFKQLDTNHDEKLSKAEFTPVAYKMLEMTLYELKMSIQP